MILLFTDFSSFQKFKTNVKKKRGNNVKGKEARNKIIKDSHTRRADLLMFQPPNTGHCQTTLVVKMATFLSNWDKLGGEHPHVYSALFSSLFLLGEEIHFGTYPLDFHRERCFVFCSIRCVLNMLGNNCLQCPSMRASSSPPRALVPWLILGGDLCDHEKRTCPVNRIFIKSCWDVHSNAKESKRRN